MLLCLVCYAYIPLTFTIGWLKRAFKAPSLFVNLLFNFHHRVVETYFVSYFQQHVNIFNFHHRVVETSQFLHCSRTTQSFNFHHRVVETFIVIPPIQFLFTLTFTIGWLKPALFRALEAHRTPLTFTIGWLKLNLN